MSEEGAQLSVEDHRRDGVGLTYVYAVVSRRAGGVSVGINLNTNNTCNWRCLYCQVPGLRRGAPLPVDLALLERELAGFLDELLHGDFMQRQVPSEARRLVDVAFSGNGEPTLAPEFPQAVALAGRVLQAAGVAETVLLRVITNGSLLGRSHVQDGLRRLGELGGEAWFKIDAGTAAARRRINGVELSSTAVARNLRRCTQLCPTWVQTCLFALDGRGPDESEIEAYLDVLAQAGVARLRGVLLYGLARPSCQPEAGRLSRLAPAALEAVARRVRALGLAVRVSP